MNIYLIVLTAIISYLIGSISFSIILTKILKKQDIRKLGSGNAGATNTLRVLGKFPAVMVALMDIAKCFFAVFIAKLILGGDANYIIFIMGILCVLGHMFPLFFGFKGGKGIASSAGLILAIDWRSGLILIGLWVVILALTRYVSVASILGSVGIPVSMFFLYANENQIYMTLLGLFMTGLLVFMHRSNIIKLLNKTEHRFGKKKGD